MNQHIQIQRQQLRRQQVELESALEQLEDSPESYKMIGSLMIKQDAQKISTQLQQQLSKIKQQIAILDEQVNES